MTTDTNFTCIRNLKHGMKQLNIIFIVLEIGKPTTTKDGHTIRRVKVADKTGCIDLSVWDEYGAVMQAGDICKILKGYANIWKDALTLYSGKGGEIQKIDDFCMAFVENPNMSEPNSELVKQQRMNGAPSQGGAGGHPGGGVQSQEQQPPPGGDAGADPGTRGVAREGGSRGDPRSGAGKMTRNGPAAPSGQNNLPQNRQKPYPAKKPLGSQNSGNAAGPKESGGLRSSGEIRGSAAVQGFLKR